MSREIIINKMYAGDYLTTGENIGHEIINLYRADDGRRYIFLCPGGRIDRKHREKRITMVMVRRFSANTYKILARAEGISVLDCAVTGLALPDACRMQKDMHITYNGVPIEALFGGNLYKGAVEEETVCVTFQAERIIRPKGALFITDTPALANGTDTFSMRTPNGFGKSALREYYDEEEKPESFADLNRVLTSAELWEEEDTTVKVSVLTDPAFDKHPNMLKVIGRENDEWIFSNLLAYFFRANRKAMALFAKEVLGVELSARYTVEREREHMDLLITDAHTAIVIENKIKSSINGVTAGGRHDLYGEAVQSQLKTYYRYVTTDEAFRDMDAHFFIFTPDYNKIDTAKFSEGHHYRIIPYSRIYRFFCDRWLYYKDVPYFIDFVNALYKHTREYETDLEEEMQARFLRAVERCRNEKSEINH